MKVTVLATTRVFSDTRIIEGSMRSSAEATQAFDEGVGDDLVIDQGDMSASLVEPAAIAAFSRATTRGLTSGIASALASAIVRSPLPSARHRA